MYGTNCEVLRRGDKKEMKLSDDELQKRCDRLCEKYLLVHGFATNLGVPDSYRDDLIQEIFVAAYLNIHKLKNMDSLEPWLYKISYRKMIYFSKQHRLRLEREFSYGDCYKELETDRKSNKLLWNTMDNGLSDEELCDMVSSLKPPAPYIIKLRFEMGFNLKEISDILDLNYNTVKTIEYRALKKLKVMIEERGCRQDEGEKA